MSGIGHEADRGRRPRRPPRLRRGALALVAGLLVATGCGSPAKVAVVPSDVPSPTSSVVELTAFGARGDGTSDNTAVFRAALAAVARSGRTLVVPAGSFKVGALVVPDGVSLVGASAAASRIVGAVQAGSHSRFAHLTMGAAGSAFGFTDGATHTTFDDVSFIGGGSMASGERQGVVRFSAGRSASFITFRDCTIGANPTDGNGVSIVDNGWSGATYHDLLWQHCHFLGSPRMSFECIRRGDGVHPLSVGYHNIDLVDCTFEPAGSEAISYDGGAPAGHSVVSGCLVRGSGTNSAYPWGQAVEFNDVVGMTFSGNTVDRCRDSMINHSGRPGAATGNVFTHNTFDSTVSHMTRPTRTGSSIISFEGVANAIFSDNVVKIAAGANALYLGESSSNTFARDQWTDVRSAAAAGTIALVTDRSSQNTFTDCSFASALPTSILTFTAGADHNVIAACTVTGGGSTPIQHDPQLTLTLSGITYR